MQYSQSHYFCHSLLLQTYLSTLRKKQREVKKKKLKQQQSVDKEDDEGTEDDSSFLASLAKEFAKEEIQDSPFLKRKDQARPASSPGSAPGTPLPEKDAPFVTSLAKKPSPFFNSPGTAQTLDNFVKYERKYSSRFKTNAAAEASGDDEDISVSEKHLSKVERTSKFKQVAKEKSLTLQLPTTSSRTRKQSAETTASEVSELPQASGSRSATPSPSPSGMTGGPVLLLEDLHDIDELEENIILSDDVDEGEQEGVVAPVESSLAGTTQQGLPQEAEEVAETQIDKPDVPAPVNLVDPGSIPVTEAATAVAGASSVTSSSTCTSTTLKPDRKDKHRKKKKRDKARKRHNSDPSCRECARLCEFHRSQLQKPQPPKSDSCVQTTQGWDQRPRSSYLFDPSQDLLVYEDEEERRRPLRPRTAAVVNGEYEDAVKISLYARV